MSFVPGPEAEDFRGQLRKFLGQHAGRDRLRAQIEASTGYDASLWRRAVDELGLTGLTVPEAAGGSGADLLTAGVLFEELGRALVCAPFLSTVALAVEALRACAPPDVAGPTLTAIAGGTVATLVWAGERPAESTLTATGTRVCGTAAHVVDGADAKILLVAARAGNATALFRVDADGDPPGLRRTPLAVLDTTRRLSRLDFQAVTGTLLAADCGPGLEQALDIATLLLAAEQAGAARRAMEMAVDYAKTRYQFGRPIGSFQAVKHRCADLLIDVELATSLVQHGLHRVDEEPSAAAVEAAIVGGFVPDVFLAVAAANIQLHGGIGFTWEHDAHLYLKRAKSTQLIFGTPTAARRRAARLLGVDG